MSDPWLLTPGPLTTSATVKRAMLHDWGSRDEAFISMTARVRDRLVALANAEATHVCVPMQGSGTFAIEAVIGTLVPRDGKLLVLVNGAYGKRMVSIAKVMRRSVVAIETAEDTQVSPADLQSLLESDPLVTHVAVVHCETTSGILNPIEEVAEVCSLQARPLIIDAMSTFGALPLDARSVPFEAVVASAGKCLEGVPGIGFAIIRRDALERSRGNAHSLSLDLEEQWQGFVANGQWRFTPPTHVLAALDCAIDELAAEGGAEGRLARYRRNHEVLIEGMADLGFETLLPRRLQAPIIVTFLMPADPAFACARFCELLRESGFIIYPSKLTIADSFRIGCIGRLGEAEMRAAVDAVRTTLVAMGVTSGAPRQQPLDVTDP
jgi:2-aminoethylphosphonate-pyruvate transaminase